MTNADKFKNLFGIYATELWSMPEKDFLEWLNSEAMNSLEIPNNSDTISRQTAIDATWFEPSYTDPLNVLTEVRDRLKALPSAQPEKRTETPARDCISRQAAIRIASGYCHPSNIANELAKLPSAQPEQRWIPVSERLPEEFICDDGYVEPSDYVLVWGDNGNYGVSRYWGNRCSKSERPNTYKDWVDLDWEVQKPIAWMPLPPSSRRSRATRIHGKEQTW